jgi:hypothetical protein
MNNSLLCIQQKIDNLQYGLLRFQDSAGPTTLHVKASTNEDATFNCIIVEDSFDKKLYNTSVNLIQKSYNDYIYITGKVAAEARQGSKILAIRIIKACWFERIYRGNTSWLREKCMFESSVPELEFAG